jgi:epoxyqueuosine reductase
MIKSEAARLGFNACGIARGVHLEKESMLLKLWLKKKYHGTMQYMENHFEKRVDVSKLVPGTQSVIVVLLNYYTDKKQVGSGVPLISKYALGMDYHQVMRNRLKLLLQFINNKIGKTSGRAFSDSAPVMDKVWGMKAGLGWISKNTNLIAPGIGSFTFIGTLLIDRLLHYDEPMHDLCGDCLRCLKACPTKAIVQPYVLDASRCISYHTIENKGSIPDEFKGKFRNRVFGCDICQDVCPWNRQAKPHNNAELMPANEIIRLSKEELYNLSEEQFKKIFKDSAVKRIGYKRFMRNMTFVS